MTEEERGGMPSSAEQCGKNDDYCVGRTTQNNLQQNDEEILSSPLKVDGYDDETIQMQLSANSQDLLLVASITLICFSLVAWFLFRHLKQQKEWQQASNLQLKQISLRNNMQSNLQPKEEEKRTIKAAATETNAASKNSTDTCKGIDNDRVRSIRAQQQKQHEIKAKLAKQQKRLAEKEKKKLIHESLQHEAADQAYERRRQVIREEQSMLQAATHEISISNEAEETERRELLRMQNLEYEESLRLDQERFLQATIETERCRRRATALQDAIHRLERAGIYTSDLPIIEQNTITAVEINDEDKIQVRLMLPSGKRVQVTYSKYHSIGLIYDFALVILNYNQQDQDKHISTQEVTRSHSERRAHAELKELFDPFTIKTTFPPQTFEEMDLTLEQCGLQQSVMLMVTVESD
mmetsp:Transcript_25176/g.42770  ORF Transcript_25176/g.42770 Transcript_25176/m.42770 type:complete len:409 (-) Transcript_25176:1106-2332(-)